MERVICFGVLNITKQSVIDFIVSFHSEHGHPPTNKEWKGNTDAPCSITTYRRMFGSYTSLIVKLGMRPNKSENSPTLVEMICSECGGKKKIRASQLNRKKKDVIFCSRKCSSVFYGKKRKLSERGCLCCGKTFNPTRSSHVCCSFACREQYRKEKFITDWKLGKISGNAGQNVSETIKRYLREKFHNKCTRCGWSEVNKTTNIVPLTVEHIDGNSSNSREENLDLICPNCHSLTSTYGALNRGRGRLLRRRGSVERVSSGSATPEVRAR